MMNSLQDLCADVPMEGLHMEVQAIQESMQLLSDKLDHARLVHIYFSTFPIGILSIEQMVAEFFLKCESASYVIKNKCNCCLINSIILRGCP